MAQLKNREMRGILVTPVEIEGAGPFRKRRERLAAGISVRC
jgi:hypothetical protein